jgi:hypothetical protein
VVVCSVGLEGRADCRRRRRNRNARRSGLAGAGHQPGSAVGDVAFMALFVVNVVVTAIGIKMTVK